MAGGSPTTEVWTSSGERVESADATTTKRATTTRPAGSATPRATAAWPSYSRVNHQKFIVTDRRVNVGTSNWEWGYFHNTAGASFNTDDAPLRAAAQAAFDADWESPYAQPLV